MITFYVIIISLGALGAICAVLIATVLHLSRKLAKQSYLLHHGLQNLRYEMNTKLYPLEKSFYTQIHGSEEIVYDGRAFVDANDFTGNGALAWDYVAHRFADGKGEGSHEIKDNVITISRSNTAGRYELYLKRFVFDGVNCITVPVNTTQDIRRLRLTGEVKKETASHLLRFVFKGEESKEVLDEKDYVAFSPDWEKIELHFWVSAKEASIFRIDDLSVLEAPSAVQIRNLVLMEKK